MRMSSVLPAILFLACFIRQADRQAWLLEKFPPGISASRDLNTGIPANRAGSVVII